MKKKAPPRITTLQGAMEMLADVQARLAIGKATIDEVKVAVACVNAFAKVIVTRQEQARLAGLRVTGDVITDVQFDANAKPTAHRKWVPEEPAVPAISKPKNGVNARA